MPTLLNSTLNQGTFLHWIMYTNTCKICSSLEYCSLVEVFSGLGLFPSLRMETITCPVRLWSVLLQPHLKKSSKSLFPLYVRMHIISSRRPVLSMRIETYKSSLYLRASWLLVLCLIGRMKTPGKLTPNKLVQTFMVLTTVLYMQLTIEGGSLIS